MSKTSISGIFVFMFALSNIATAQTSDIASVVKHCVGVVNNTNPKQAYMKSFYEEFDAYYVPSTKLVHNNARSVGAQKPLFQFQKCMAQQGVPLTSSK